MTNSQDCNGACYSADFYECVNGKLQQHANATKLAGNA